MIIIIQIFGMGAANVFVIDMSSFSGFIKNIFWKWSSEAALNFVFNIIW